MFPAASISGQSSEGFYSQTLTVGNFLVILLLEGLNSEEELHLGHDILSKFEETVETNPEISPVELLEIQKQRAADNYSFHMLVAKIADQKLSLSALGKVGAKLIRSGKVVNLTAESNQGIRNVSGPLLFSDILIAGTTAFFTSTPAFELINLASMSDLEMKESLTAQIENRENRSQMAMIFMRVGRQEESEKISPVAPPIPPTTSITTGKAVHKSILSKLTGEGQWLPSKFNVRDPSSKRVLYLTALVLIVFISIVSFQLRSKTLETDAKNLAAIEKQVNDGLASSNKLIGLNDQIARETLFQTKDEATRQIEKFYGADWQKKDSPVKKKLVLILARINEQMAKVSHSYQVPKLEKFYDFSLMKSGPKIVSANVHDGLMVAVDQANGAIYSVKTSNKAAELILGNPELKRANFIDFTSEVVYLWTREGIFQKKNPAGESLKQIVKASDRWGRIKHLAAFGGNLYLLDSQNNQIWKYQGTDLGFTDATNYIKTGLSVDISNGESMAVDGFIYVLTRSGQVAKFAGGDVSEFRFSGLPEASFSPSSLFTSEEVNNVYFWDSKSKKITVTDKKGVYVAEYKIAAGGESLGAKTIILADEKAKRIFLISEEMVYSINLL